MRSFNSLSLVALPRLDVLGSLTLSAQLITTAEATGEPAPPVKVPLAKLKKARKILRDKRRSATPALDLATAQDVDRQLDAAYRAFDAFLSSWEQLGGPEAADAALVRTTLFPDGLKFTQLPFRQQWAASETRIDQLKAGGLDAIVTRLGGERFLKLLYREHARYGEVLSITKEPTEPTDASMREEYAALLSALRDYIVAVVATGVAGDEADQEKVDRMLRPIADWPSRKPGAQPDDGGGDGPDAPPPAPPVEPAPAAPNGTAPSVPSAVSPPDS